MYARTGTVFAQSSLACKTLGWARPLSTEFVTKQDTPRHFAFWSQLSPVWNAENIIGCVVATMLTLGADTSCIKNFSCEFSPCRNFLGRFNCQFEEICFCYLRRCLLTNLMSKSDDISISPGKEVLAQLRAAEPNFMSHPVNKTCRP